MRVTQFTDQMIGMLGVPGGNVDKTLGEESGAL